MLTIRTVALVGLGVALGSTATLRAAPDNLAPPRGLTIYHWWTSRSEVAAFQALVDLFNKKYPDVAVSASSAPSGGASGMFPIVKRLAQAGQAPGTFQLNAGYAMQPFMDAGLLSPIDALWESEQLDTVFSAVIRDLNKVNGHYYSVPIGVHRKNIIWYNKWLLDRSKIDPNTLTTWDAFFKAADKLEANGVPAAIQSCDATASQVFEGIMAGMGKAAYEDWINGSMKDAGDPRLTEALGIFKKYVVRSNRDHATLTWDVAIQRVMKGDGAFCLMGDWANGEFRVAGMRYGKEYGSILVPGTRGMFGLSLDTFQHPARSRAPANAERWLRLASSREGQDAFNPIKGSISARNDADTSKYDAYQRSSIADLNTSRLIYPSIAQGAPSGYYSRLTEVLAAFMSDLDVQKAASALAAASTQFRSKYTRAWSLQERSD